MCLLRVVSPAGTECPPMRGGTAPSAGNDNAGRGTAHRHSAARTRSIPRMGVPKGRPQQSHLWPRALRGVPGRFSIPVSMDVQCDPFLGAPRQLELAHGRLLLVHHRSGAGIAGRRAQMVRLSSQPSQGSVSPLMACTAPPVVWTRPFACQDSREELGRDPENPPHSTNTTAC